MYYEEIKKDFLPLYNLQINLKVIQISHPDAERSFTYC